MRSTAMTSVLVLAGVLLTERGWFVSTEPDTRLAP
jgi:hypothetical protein